jgi:hypothetical protein
MIKNGLYALNASCRNGIADDDGGVLILRDANVSLKRAAVAAWSAGNKCLKRNAMVDFKQRYVSGQARLRWEPTDTCSSSI